MRASEVLGTLQQRGITLKVVAGSLKISGVNQLTDREKVALRAHKSALLKALATDSAVYADPANPVPVEVSSAITEPAERVCKNCAHFEPYPYEPLGSCHALKRMQHATSKPTRFGCSHFERKERRS